MARRIIWTLIARKELKEILAYWKERNRSNVYSKKLKAAIAFTVTEVAINPKIGSKTASPNVRKKVLKDYIIAYEEIKSGILILSVWDTRQNPEKLKSRLSEK
ncbi:type II toxin-antitoxin system RelE/ParE family toxin [Taibaiella soli]|uniref:Type II toxin-antitoxin system RelE/ParE family toxin n=1 Tax=Taibaiella soli TaxID=1649169 RepID=A0A2W2B2K7_9BACT|nr:type II toxin-antitoxin system RelE/ParE family toxin [Taibaiella soli]PZF74268.1 type II toxin-antitoxin system RelE/ParE family toxin [Taibaiella soli]